MKHTYAILLPSAPKIGGSAEGDDSVLKQLLDHIEKWALGKGKKRNGS